MVAWITAPVLFPTVVPVSSARMWPVLNLWLQHGLSLISDCSKCEFGFGFFNSGLYQNERIHSPPVPTWASSPDGCEAKMLQFLWLEQTPAWYHDYRMGTWKVYLFECKLQIIIFFKALCNRDTWRHLLEKTWLFEILDYGDQNSLFSWVLHWDRSNLCLFLVCKTTDP